MRNNFAPSHPDAELANLRLRRRALQGRIEALASGAVRVQELRSTGFVDVTSQTVVELYRELGEIGRQIHSAQIALRSDAG
jgi:hypothetical protein